MAAGWLLVFSLTLFQSLVMNHSSEGPFPSPTTTTRGSLYDSHELELAQLGRSYFWFVHMDLTSVGLGENVAGLGPDQELHFAAVMPLLAIANWSLPLYSGMILLSLWIYSNKRELKPILFEGYDFYTKQYGIIQQVVIQEWLTRKV